MTGSSDRIHPSFSIVIADDEESITSSISYMLRSNNITNIVTVNDSREVVPTLDRTNAGILFIDLTMPQVTGQELIPVIKASSRETPKSKPRSNVCD
jgi:DNA-binding NtrC family response regulator